MDEEEFPSRPAYFDLGHDVGDAPIPGREDVEQLSAARLDAVEASSAMTLPCQACSAGP